MANIVFEGPKGTGKTTAIRLVNDIFPTMSVIHMTKDTPNTYDYHMTMLAHDNYIFDRFALGELIYPQIYGREGKLSILQFLQIMSSKDIDYVFFTYSSDPQLLIDRIRERDGEVNEDEVIQSNAAFITMYEALKLTDTLKDSPFVFVDVAKEDLLQVVFDMLGWYI